MKKKNYELVESNVGKIDQFVRMFFGIVSVSVAIYQHDSEMMDEILLISAIILFSTGYVGYCPVYTFLAINTNINPVED